MRNFILTLLILGFFYWIAVATSYQKDPYFMCENHIMDYLNDDTNSYAYAYPYVYSNDTIVIRAVKDTLWDIKTNEICKLMQDSCKFSGYKVLVIDTSNNPSAWNTPYGKQIYLRQCP